jgi:hypothetical protein
MCFAAWRAAAAADPDFTRNAIRAGVKTSMAKRSCLCHFSAVFSYDVCMIRRPKRVMYKPQIMVVMNRC